MKHGSSTYLVEERLQHLHTGGDLFLGPGRAVEQLLDVRLLDVALLRRHVGGAAFVYLALLAG